MNIPKSWKTLEIEQQCRFGWTLDVVKRFVEWTVIKDYAYILHDKDVKEDGTHKEDHIHLMLRFNDSVPTPAILARAKAVCGNDETIKIEQLERCKKWKSAVAYLTHENVQGKHIYDRAEVVSNYNFEQDIEDVLTDDVRKKKLIYAIASGEIKLYNIHKHVDAVDYDRWKKSIDNAFDYRQKLLLERGDRDMRCIYIQGDSGVGKTTYAKMLCEQKEFSYFVSSGSNDVLDGYAGQDAIILDDLRPSALRLVDLLKMLDNNTASSVPSRYHNKVLECRLIIITTVLPIDSFFNEVFKEQPETAKQLRRRCTQYFKMERETLECGQYNAFNDRYLWLPALPNPVAVKYGFTEEKTAEIMVNSLRETLRGTVPDELLEDAVRKVLEKNVEVSQNE